MKILKASTAMLVLLVGTLSDVNASLINRNLQKTEANTEAAISDAMITAKVKELFFIDEDLESLRIHVKTKNGIVTLSGMVTSEFDRNLAITLANSVNEVVSVQSKLKLLEED
jgi:hyperosmotically inducible protein